MCIGKYLREGRSSRILSLNITDHEDYKLLFKNMILEVNPGENDSWITKYFINSSKYVFYFNRQLNRLIIDQYSQKEKKKPLFYRFVPRTLLKRSHRNNGAKS